MQHAQEITCSNCRYWQAMESPPNQEKTGEYRDFCLASSDLRVNSAMETGSIDLASSLN